MTNRNRPRRGNTGGGATESKRQRQAPSVPPPADPQQDEIWNARRVNAVIRLADRIDRALATARSPENAADALRRICAAVGPARFEEALRVSAATDAEGERFRQWEARR